MGVAHYSLSDIRICGINGTSMKPVIGAVEYSVVIVKYSEQEKDTCQIIFF